jgi:hypothetical protein
VRDLEALGWLTDVIDDTVYYRDMETGFFCAMKTDGTGKKILNDKMELSFRGDIIGDSGDSKTYRIAQRIFLSTYPLAANL